MWDHINDWIAANWLKVFSLMTFFMVFPAYLRARYLWKRRQFLTRINFSLNFCEDNTLKFRTLRETDLAHVLLNNTHAIRQLMKTARGRRRGAFLLFKDREEAWTLLTTLLNELSAQFSDGYVARSMGLPTQSEWYYIGVTCERHGDLKATKIRVMMIPRKLLMELDKYESVQFEQPHHHIRLATLKEMRDIALDKDLRHNLMEMELTVKK
jgi:hypothetical protein